MDDFLFAWDRSSRSSPTGLVGVSQWVLGILVALTAYGYCEATPLSLYDFYTSSTLQVERFFLKTIDYFHDPGVENSVFQVGICAKGARGVGFQLLCHVFCDDKSPFARNPSWLGQQGSQKGQWD